VPGEALDPASVIAACEAVAAEMLFDNVIEKLTVAAIELSGAERGLLILQRRHESWIEAEGARRADGAAAWPRQDVVRPSDLAYAVLQATLQTHEPIHLDDAAVSPAFSQDRYVTEKQARSVMCVPLMRQGEAIGVLYLENNLAARAFTPARWDALRLLARSGATSLQNARLYRELNKTHTDRLLASALRRSEERFARAIEAAGFGHSEWNVETGEFYVSPRLLEICGFPSDTPFRDREEWLLQFPVHPDDRDKWDAAIRAHLAGELDDFRLEVRILVAGETRWVEKRYISARDSSGTPTVWTGLTADITERRTASEVLQAKEARFRSLTELSSDWYWSQGEDLRFNYLSNQADDLTGYTGQSSIGKLRWELERIYPLSGSWEEHKADLAARRPFRDLQEARVAPDGKIWYLSISGAPIYDEQGRFRGYHGTGRDITESKRIEEELRSRQEMLDLAQKSAGAVAWQWRYDVEPAENRWSEELEAMFDIPAGSFDGTSSAWRKLIHPDDQARVRAALKHAMNTRDVDVEYRVPRRDGTIRWLHQKGRMLIGSDGKPARAIGFMFDVTEKHQSEEDVARLERQLRLAQRLESMGTLAGGIAHDFNNILGAILGYGEMAMRNAQQGTRLWRDLTSIMTAGERGRALVDRVLAFSRSGVGEKVAFHAEKVVSEAIGLLAAKVPEGVRLDIALHAGAAAIRGDPTQIHQVLMNLGTNAMQAMPTGGFLRISLDARQCAERTATIGTVAAADYVVLAVRDTGTGMARELIDRIFDPFFTTKEVGTGTGLGLSLVHGIVADLGGAIDVASVPGVGSEFTVYFPRAGDAVAEVDRSSVEASPAPRGDGQRILIVDDEEPLCALAARGLRELGYVPTTFTSSTAALAAFRSDPGSFDIVLTDERMPGLSGISLIRELRDIRATIPILLVTGYVGTTVVRRAKKAGANEVLRKPLSMRDLAVSVSRALQP
jgi:PAS domain S-box-containing protein